MKQLTCEMCGSTELVKDGGFFVCQTCGTKYSVEDAKKMMIEGTVDVQGTVRVENQSNVEGLMRIARAAFESGNYEKAIDKCDEIISMSSNNYEAWKLKADSLIKCDWKSEKESAEAYSSLMSAIQILDDNITDEQKGDIIDSCEILFGYNTSFLLNSSDNFSDIKADTIIEKIKKFKNNYEKFLTCLNLSREEQAKYSGNLNTLIIRICSSYSSDKLDALCEYYYDYHASIVKKELYPDGTNWDHYKSEKTIKKCQCSRTDYDDIPDEDKWSYFAYIGVSISEILMYCIDSIDQYTSSIAIEEAYVNLIYAERHLATASPYRIDEKVDKETGYITRKVKESYSQKSSNIKLEALENALTANRRMDNEVRERRIKEYWDNHGDEKAELDARKAELENKISALQEKKKAFCESEEIVTLVEQVDKLAAEKKSLGLFKGKQKKAIQAQIDELNKKREAYWNSDSVLPILNELEKSEFQLEEVIEQLTMDR